LAIFVCPPQADYRSTKNREWQYLNDPVVGSVDLPVADFAPVEVVVLIEDDSSPAKKRNIVSISSSGPHKFVGSVKTSR